jgi:hypothetical protein
MPQPAGRFQIENIITSRFICDGKTYTIGQSILNGTMQSPASQFEMEVQISLASPFGMEQHILWPVYLRWE